MGNVIGALIGYSVRRPWLMLAFFASVLAAGLVAFLRLDIEAYPDPVPPLVDVVTQSPGQSAEEIERYVTMPLEQALAGLPHLASIRTISLFGLSDTKLQFTYDIGYQDVQQAVVGVLAQVNNLPTGVTPQISPWSPIGEIYRYRLVGPPGMPVADLRAIQDFDLEHRFKAIPGVIDVTGWGGPTRAAIVAVDLDKMNAAGVTLAQLVQAIGANDQNVGGRTIEFGAHAATVRGVGLIRSLDDIRDTLITAGNGAPVRVADIATVEDGFQPRLGIAGMDDDDDIVEGIVLMRRGEYSLPTIRRVEAAVQEINASGVLPPGVGIALIYDRSDLIGLTTRTVLTNLLVGIALIFVVQWVFLGDLRSALVVSATIPFALAFAVILLVVRGESANLLSVGAIDFGLIVAATVIVVESIFRHLGDGAPDIATAERAGVIRRAVAEVDRGVLFSTAIIVASFVPLFTLSGVEGHIFAPMARTYAYAIAGALIATFTVSPALSVLLLRGRIAGRHTLVVLLLRRLYRPVLDFMLANRILALGGAFWLAMLAIAAAWSLGLEFLPHLEERNLWIRATMPQSISLETGSRLVSEMRATIRRALEVTTVISQLGRPDDGTDATGFFNAEFYVPLLPRSQWRYGVWTKDDLTDRIEDELRVNFPGVTFNFSQYIQDNVEEAASGVKGENAVKIYGDDLVTLEATAVQVRDAMRTVFGITDLAIFNALGQLTLSIDADRARAARLGISVADINAAVQTGIGGQLAGNLYERNTARYSPILVRFAPTSRDDVPAIGRVRLLAALPGGGTLPVALSDVARISLANGPGFIYRENQQRYVPVKFSVRLRAVGSAVREAQQRVREQVKVPPGVRVEWVGEYGDLQEALGRLAVVVPISLALIVLLLLAQFASIVDMLLAASVMPMALAGGLFALALTGTPLSVSAAIGFVGLLGISVMEGIIILSGFNALVDAGAAPKDALRRTCDTRLRPVLMTCFAACVGLLPAAVSRGIGAQVQGPLAIVVVGGSLLAPLLVLIIVPVLIQQFSPRYRAAPQVPAPAPGQDGVA